MDIKIETDWTVGDLIDHQSGQFLRVNHEYQRGARWSPKQRQLFIDSILRGYSIPAFYFHLKKSSTKRVSNTTYDIVDGQQRINAIYDFSEGAFPLLKATQIPHFMKDAPCPWGGQRFGELSSELQEQIRSQQVVVYLITTEDENAIRDLFIRLQGGTALTAQEKRDSWPGDFTKFVLEVGGKTGEAKWYGLPLFTKLARGNEIHRRQLVAQAFMLFSKVRNSNSFCNIHSSEIDEFYQANVDFDEASRDSRDFKKLCGFLHTVLDGSSGRLPGHYIIHLLLLVDSLRTEYVNGWEANLASNLTEFERRCKEAADQEKLGLTSRYDKYHTEYGQLIRTSSDNARTIRRRHAFFSERMLEMLEPRKKDSKRLFTELERKVVFFRDSEICQWCLMKGKGAQGVAWEDCEIHHVTPHGEGGLTKLENAALVHRECHPKGSSKPAEFREWFQKRGSRPIVELDLH